MQDVCKRDLHEQLLRTQADLRHAQEIAHLGIWAADMRTGIVETTSPETFRIFHLSEDRKPIRVDDLLQHIHPDDLRACSAPSNARCASPARATTANTG
jgi:PAS domain-containing protein